MQSERTRLIARAVARQSNQNKGTSKVRAFVSYGEWKKFGVRVKLVAVGHASSGGNRIGQAHLQIVVQIGRLRLKFQGQLVHLNGACRARFAL